MWEELKINTFLNFRKKIGANSKKIIIWYNFASQNTLPACQRFSYSQVVINFLKYFPYCPLHIFKIPDHGSMRANKSDLKTWVEGTLSSSIQHFIMTNSKCFLVTNEFPPFHSVSNCNPRKKTNKTESVRFSDPDFLLRNGRSYCQTKKRQFKCREPDRLTKND